MPKKITISLYFSFTLCKKCPQKTWVEAIKQDQHPISPRGLIRCAASTAQAQGETWAPSGGCVLPEDNIHAGSRKPEECKRV